MVIQTISMHRIDASKTILNADFIDHFDAKSLYNLVGPSFTIHMLFVFKILKIYLVYLSFVSKKITQNIEFILCYFLLVRIYYYWL